MEWSIFRIKGKYIFIFAFFNEILFFSYTLVVKNMQLINRVRNFLVDQNYYIDIYENKVHIFHYVDIIKLQDEEIVLQMDGFQIVLTGANFRVGRLENREILISGIIENLKFVR